MSIHSRNEQVILEFGLKKPAYRICREHAGDAGRDWIHHRPRSGDDAGLRRVRRQHHLGQHLAAASAQHQAARVRDSAGLFCYGCRRCSGARGAAGASGATAATSPGDTARLPQAPAKPPVEPISADSLTRRIDAVPLIARSESCGGTGPRAIEHTQCTRCTCCTAAPARTCRTCRTCLTAPRALRRRQSAPSFAKTTCAMPSSGAKRLS